VGHALQLATVGVGVETAEVLASLRRLGVDFAQGFGIARPEPLDVALGRLTGEAPA
jgi:EAL domain-containing protein (putative c-di-GMP-specific phosphodiesterase class I)